MKRTTEFGFSGTFATDTAFVLLFLSIEYGRAIHLLTLDGVLMAITMMMVLVLPYFLPTSNEKPHFTNWLIGRGSIAMFGIVLGVIFTQSLGVIVPQSLKFMPMTLLIVAAMISCYIQFYGLLKLRLAK